MLKDLLSKTQPVAFTAIQTALVNHTVSHAYIFTGPAGTPKKEAAYLLAQSLFCTHTEEGLACQSCDTCKRIEEGAHMDFVYLDGNAKSISKKDVDDLQLQFSKTSSEEGTGTRCYILDHFENSSSSAMNSLLKFLEEPGKDVVGILITDNIHRILPTIVSRCTMIPFTAMTSEYRMTLAKEEGIPEEDCWMFSHVIHANTGLKDIYESDVYSHALDMLHQYLLGDKEELLVDYDVSYKLSERSSCIELVRLFLDMLNTYCHDVICHSAQGPHWYVSTAGRETDLHKMTKMLICVNTQMDKCNKYNDPYLVLAQTMYMLEEL